MPMGTQTWHPWAPMFVAENLLRGGRAVLLPLWKGSYERSDGFDPLYAAGAAYRTYLIQWVSEIRRSVDYLQTRDDIDPERIGYQGISYGATWVPVFLAQEPRLRTGLLIPSGTFRFRLDMPESKTKIVTFDTALELTMTYVEGVERGP